MIGLADFIIGQVLENLENQNQAEKTEDFLDPDITIIPVYKEEN